MGFSCNMVIFGASGDLTHRLLVPALYYLKRSQQLPKNFSVLGVSRSPLSDEDFRVRLKKFLRQEIPASFYDESQVDELLSKVFYYSMDTTQPNEYVQFKNRLNELERQGHSERNTLFYLATPPDLFHIIPENLAHVGLLHEDQGNWRRIIVEKPFGTDLQSARDLNLKLSEFLKESQIFRIDHYLGKETVQNILVLRFANGIFEPIWNRNYIDSIQITVAETFGIENRGGYYDKAGAIRDMIPNHLFQLVSLIGMEPPNSFEPNDVRDEKLKCLKAVVPFSSKDIQRCVVRGQYDSYRSEAKVKPNSETETFAALKLELDNWRWSGVPFYLRTGKKLKDKSTEVVVQFRCAPFEMFRGLRSCELVSNTMIFEIQPRERVRMKIDVKIPGPEIKTNPVLLDFDYQSSFGAVAKTGYETLLLDAMKGDATLFLRGDQIEEAWKIIDPVLQHPIKPSIYSKGSWGPTEADWLLNQDGRSWFSLNTVTPSVRRVA
jgi:glucose-6-phosphate 1-dehydrogenase